MGNLPLDSVQASKLLEKIIRKPRKAALENQSEYLVAWWILLKLAPTGQRAAPVRWIEAVPSGPATKSAPQLDRPSPHFQ